MKISGRIADLAEYAAGNFVPTMGALHRGHAALIDAARASAQAAARSAARTSEAPASASPVIVSIFVNPTQFGPGEDFERYPQSLDADVELCRAHGVDFVFTPKVADIYPPGFKTSVTVTGLGAVLCGAHRPGHFAGVATVVARLLGLVKPRRAFFGWKDAQQLIIIRRMVEDLMPGVEIVPVETVREPDGLAISSRNAYLSPADRAVAPELYRGLKKGEAAALEGARTAEIVMRVQNHLKAHGLKADYVELRRLGDLGEVETEKPVSRHAGARMAGHTKENATGYLLAAAVRLGTTRLIDNVRLFAGPRL